MFLFFLNLAILKWVVSRKNNNPNVEKSLRRSVLDFFFNHSSSDLFGVGNPEKRFQEQGCLWDVSTSPNTADFIK